MNVFMKATALAAAVFIGSATADTLELSDGTLLEGDFVGSSNGIVMFNTGSQIEAFPEDEVAGIFLSSGANKLPQQQAPQQAQPEPAPQAQLPAAPVQVTIPSGTRLVIRTAEGIDSKRQGAGHRFRGQLEGAVAIDGMTVLPRGTFLHGRITQAKSGGRAFGSSEMSIEFTDIMVDDQLFEISTTELKAKTGNEAGKTAGRTARAAVIGGLANGSKGARYGAAIGAGASILTSGSSINVPAGTILETSLRTPLTLPAL
jgi:hypothetical protein